MFCCYKLRVTSYSVEVLSSVTLVLSLNKVDDDDDDDDY